MIETEICCKSMDTIKQCLKYEYPEGSEREQCIRFHCIALLIIICFIKIPYSNRLKVVMLSARFKKYSAKYRPPTYQPTYNTV
jgi:hypothetical protein